MKGVVVERHQFVIVGAGPGGLQLGHWLQRAGADYLVVDRADAPGAFFERFPRQRRLISLNKAHVRSDDPERKLRWDWNSLLSDPAGPLFPEYSDDYYPHADDMVRYLADFQTRQVPQVRFATTVRKVRRDGAGFVVETDDGCVSAECLVMATGWGKPNVPDIPGIGHAVGYEDAPADGAAYRGKRVLIIGKGNSAFEMAHRMMLDQAEMVHLASPNPLRLSWNTKHPGHVRGQYGALLDNYQFKTLHSVLDCTIDRIEAVDGAFRVWITYTHAQGEQEVLDYDMVVRCTGFRMDTDIFDDSCRPSMAPNGRIPALREDWRSTDIDGLYFAGTLAQARDFQRASSAFIDGFRYNLRTLSRILTERYLDIPLPHEEVKLDAESLTDAVLDRVNWSSALWTQFEYLCDALVVSGRKFRRYEDLPEDYAITRFGDQETLYTVSLRWGRADHPDVFAIERHPAPERAAESAFIHPVVRCYRFGRLVAEQHLLEDLLAEWRRPDRHVEPLQAFFRGRQ
ncbi:NAD(P)-binding domain-containing protein [Actinokineospora alba]|uniref:NAD(P)-binding domain-containing protein n=1 Tax=Actinokineospora alba TaxID=504798 RepID=UPI000B85294A|nr:NAD(P)-binding domain-containing protein [Actinokineospora alba]